MQVKVCRRFATISPKKARLVIDLVRGVRVDEAFNVLRMTPKRASPMVAKLLRAAVASAGEQHDVEADNLLVERAWVDEGPTRKSWWPRPRGMAARKRHRTSHIHLVVSGEDKTEGAGRRS